MKAKKEAGRLQHPVGRRPCRIHSAPISAGAAPAPPPRDADDAAGDDETERGERDRDEHPAAATVLVTPAGSIADTTTAAAIATGFRSRPVVETVRDTWAWVQAEGLPTPPPGRKPHGLPETLERELLAGR